MTKTFVKKEDRFIEAYAEGKRIGHIEQLVDGTWQSRRVGYAAHARQFATLEQCKDWFDQNEALHSGFSGFIAAPPPPVTAELTRFEKYAQSLGATELEAMKHCYALKQWAAAQRFKHYVPEILLAFWGLTVNTDDDKLFTLKELA